MFFYIVLILVLVPLIEITIFIEAGKYLGTLNTILIILITGIVGAIIVKIEGLRVWLNVKKELQQMRLPANSLIEALLVLVGGVLLITPGFFTDLVGLLMVLPPTRIIFRELLKKRFFKKIKSSFKVIDIK